MDLFSFQYPHSPGFKEPTTSREAAVSVAPRMNDAHIRILALLAKHPDGLTPDEAADILGESVLFIRPRFTELKLAEKIVKTGERRRNASKQSANVWRLA